MALARGVVGEQRVGFAEGAGMVAKCFKVRAAAEPSPVRDREQCGESPRVLFERLDAEELDLAQCSSRGGGVTHESLVYRSR
jgi:hypothetical protein